MNTDTVSFVYDCGSNKFGARQATARYRGSVTSPAVTQSCFCRQLLQCFPFATSTKGYAFNLYILHFKENGYISGLELNQIALDTLQIRIMGNKTQGM